MTRAELMDATRHLAPILDMTLKDVLGEKTGFMLFLFDFADRQPDGKHGSCSYISNAERADVIKLLEEIKANLEAGLTTEPLGPRGVG